MNFQGSFLMELRCEFHISSSYFHVVEFCAILCFFCISWRCPHCWDRVSFPLISSICRCSTLLNYGPNSRAEPCSKAAKKPVEPIAAVVASCHSELGRARRRIGKHLCDLCVRVNFSLEQIIRLELV